LEYEASSHHEVNVSEYGIITVIITHSKDYCKSQAFDMCYKTANISENSLRLSHSFNGELTGNCMYTID